MKYIWITAIIITVAFSSCTEKIDIELDESYDRLVVEGIITNEKKAHEVYLSTSTDFFNPEPADRVSNATVIVSDGVQTDTLTESSTAGRYLTHPDFEGVPGRTYNLSIELQQPVSGETVFTSSCKMPPYRAFDSINVVYKNRWEAWQVNAYTLEPPTVDFYRFDIYKNGVHITDTINEPFVTDDVLFNGQYSYGVTVGFLQIEKPDEIVEIGDTITARVASITEEYFTFMFDVIDESGFNSPLFEGPPANIRGNISNNGIGFFAAMAVDYESTIYEGERTN